MSSLSAPLQRSLVAKDVLSTLRYEILTGELKEGEYLREVAISKRMDVSRGPVRRALPVSYTHLTLPTNREV